MTSKHSHQQSGEPSGQEKKEGLKHLTPEQKKVKDLRGGDNAANSDKNWDEFEKQQAGGTHKGGFVQGAHGKEAPERTENLSEGM